MKRVCSVTSKPTQNSSRLILSFKDSLALLSGELHKSEVLLITSTLLGVKAENMYQKRSKLHIVMETKLNILIPICSSQANISNFITDQHHNETSSQHKACVTNNGHLVGYFCSNTAFNLSRKVSTDIEIKVLEKGLDFAPMQKKKKKN